MLKTELIKVGLSSNKAKTLLEEKGLNKLSEKKEISVIKLLFDQVKSPLVYILILAGLVTLFLKDYTDSVVIFAAVFSNTILGFYQERKAQNTLSSLSSLLSSKARVIRDGEQINIDTSEIVVGDIVVLTIGSKVPADGVLLQTSSFSVDEAILTGESMPVAKSVFKIEEIKGFEDLKKAGKENRAFMGTIISTGIAKMYITEIGMSTEMGKIGKAVGGVKESKTPLQIQLSNLGRVLAIAVGVITVIIFAVGELLGYPPLEMFTTSVAVAVAAIPEGLVVTLTVILALGMQKILKRKAVVRKLLAAETLGSVSLICSDKTGTLTEGKMRVVKNQFEDLALGIKAAILCNDLKDPLEISMWAWAKEEVKGKTSELIEKYERFDDIPFSPETKMIATLHKWEKDNMLLISGAPEVILSKSSLSESKKKKLKEDFEGFGKQGYRLVGFAHKSSKNKKISKNDLDNGFNWLGILVYEDPVRESVSGALKEANRAGIKVKVITGDYAPTAAAIMAKLGIKLSPEQIMTGEELEKISEKDLIGRIEKVVLFARTDPSQKLKIVQAFKDSNEVVAMMGDGVNDAPALKNADIGIVVGDASDVSKEIADMVLLDSNFSTIIEAIREGRNIFENIRKVVLYLLSDSFTEVILIGGSLLLGLPLPVIAVQILWVNLIEDTLPNLALAFEPDNDEVMSEPPRKRNEPILNMEMKVLIFIVGIITDVLLLALFWWFSNGGLHLHHVRTVVFATLAIDSLLYVFSCRSLTHTIFHKNPFANKHLNVAVLIGFTMLFGAIYIPFLQKFLKTHPLELSEVLVVLAIGVLNVVMIEVTKWIFIIKLNKDAKITS